MLIETFHFSFTVGDIERSVAWYTDVLGLELVHRQTQDAEYTGRFIGFPHAVLEVAQLRVPGVVPPRSTHMLELVEYRTPRGVGRPLPTNDTGVAHIAFVVDDLRAEYARLREQRVSFRSDPVEITAGVNRGGRTCYLLDPDGITLELVELPARAGAERAS